MVKLEDWGAKNLTIARTVIFGHVFGRKSVRFEKVRIYSDFLQPSFGPSRRKFVRTLRTRLFQSILSRACAHEITFHRVSLKMRTFVIHFVSSLCTGTAPYWRAFTLIVRIFTLYFEAIAWTVVQGNG